MEVSDINSTFKEWLYEKHPEVFDQYHLAIYKAGEKPEVPEGAIDLNSQTIQTLITAFHKALFLAPHPNHYTLLYNVCRQFAKRVNAENKVLELKKLYNTTGALNFPLATTEKIVFRETMFSNWSINKTYNYKGKGGMVKLNNLIEGLAYAEEKMMDIFYDICAEKDVPIASNPFASIGDMDYSKMDMTGQ